MEEKDKINYYLENLENEALIMIIKQLILHPDSKQYIQKAINEFTKFYVFPLKDEKKD